MPSRITEEKKQKRNKGILITRNEDAVVAIATSSLVNDRPATILDVQSQDEPIFFVSSSVVRLELLVALQ